MVHPSRVAEIAYLVESKVGVPRTYVNKNVVQPWDFISKIYEEKQTSYKIFEKTPLYVTCGFLE